MKNCFYKMIAALCLFPALCACAFVSPAPPDTTSPSSATDGAPPAPPPPPPKSRAEILLSSMTDAQKIGQLLMVPFSGTELTPEIKAHFTENFFSNVILFSANIPDAETARALSKEIRELSEETCGMDAWIAVDQEGGRVVRIRDEMTVFPSAREIGKTGDPENAYDAGYSTATGLLALGINFNLAPVFDVDTNPKNPIIGDRAFSDDPETAAEFALQFAKGSEDGGTPACAKHFPGHGDTSVDSHKALPVLKHDLTRLERVELYPFRRAAEAGIDAVLAGHIACPALDDSGLPASLSKKMLTGLLREKFGFEGVILTDSMDMSAITESYSPEDAAVLAVGAGADMIIAPPDPEKQNRMRLALAEALKSGELSADRLNEAVGHILAMKEKYGLLH